MSQANEKFMRRAISLAKMGAGKTAPNPVVGAVVVKGDRVIGEGYHKKVGTPHAEINALNDAGEGAKGATLYVNLEPCVHYGRTPPCVDAIIDAKISKVIVGIKDPNPVVNGKGIKKLKSSGIEVETGLLEEDCREANRSYIHRIKTGRPFVIAKAAVSLDGRIAAADGSSRWISSVAARRMAHGLRRRSDAIMVGAETIRSDNPKLTVRLAGEKRRRIVVVSESLNIPLKSAIFRIPDNVIVFATKGSSKSRSKALENMGVKVVFVRGAKGDMAWDKVLELLADDGVNQLLVEGGGSVFGSMLKAEAVDRFVIVIASKFLGDSGRPLISGLEVPNITSALNLKAVSIKRLGDEVVVEGTPHMLDQKLKIK